MPLLGLCADDRAGRSADDGANSRTARSARQHAAEYAANDSASDCAANCLLARRRRRRRCIFGTCVMSLGSARGSDKKVDDLRSGR